MSLAGRLSDLSLAELLQMLAISRKTGSLEIASAEGPAAWLGIREGGIVRVALADGSLDPDQVLEKRGVDASAPAEQREAALLDAALDALLELFDRQEGDFTFAPGADPAAAWRGPLGIVLGAPVSPQYLALEGARLADESPQPVTGLTPPPKPARAPAQPRPVICLDRDLWLLEQIKDELGSSAAPIHIFQDSASALTRLKQYLVRGESPSLVIGAQLQDPLDPRRGLGWRRFAERVRALAPGVCIAVIADGDGETPGDVAFVRRPERPRATDGDMRAFLQTLRGALRVDP